MGLPRRELCCRQLDSTQRRGGTFVAEFSSTHEAAARSQRALAAAADGFVAAASQLGLTDEAAETAVQQALARRRAQC
jgi:DNA-binding transcriptional regulator YhcF (GntR family)